MIYKNVTDQELVVMNVGVVPAGGTVESSIVIENPNLVLVAEAEVEKTPAKPESESETEVNNEAEEPAKK